MSFLSTVTIPEKTSKTLTGNKSGGFLSSIQLPQDQARANVVFDIRKRATQAQREAEELASLSGLFKETGRDVIGKTKEAGAGALSNVFQTYQQFIPKIAEDVKSGAEDIEKSFDVNRPFFSRVGSALKGLTKVGARTAGDTAIAIFAPVSAAIGAALELTQGQKLIDKTGEVVADKSGITDLEGFQKFAIEHPNAGDDFDRLLFLVLGAKDKSKIDIKKEAKVFADKLVKSEAKIVAEPPVTTPTVKGGFLESVEIPEGKPKPKEVKVEVEAVAKEVPQKPSKVALSIEQKVIEQKLSEGFEGLAGFDPITIKEQARLVSELIAKDLERAKRMVKGEEGVPDNLRGSSLIVGLEEHALKIKDVALLKDLAKSPLTAKTSRSAQELRVLAERSPDSPVRIIQDVTKVRESKLESRAKKKASHIKAQSATDLRTELRKSVSKRPTWEEFIREVQCK